MTIRNYGSVLTRYADSGVTYAGLLEAIELAYTAHKNGIGKMLVSKGFVDSNQVFNFGPETDQSINKKFRLERPEIDFEADGVEYMHTIIRPVFKYRLALGFKLQNEKASFDYEVAQDILDTVIAYLGNPANYTAFCIKLKVTKAESIQVDEHLEINLNLDVLDNITLT